MTKPIQDSDLVLHVLNVGRGDAIIIEFPVDEEGNRHYGLVDCNSYTKVSKYLARLSEARPGDPHLLFACATHPHLDHVRGLPNIIDDPRFTPRAFWDSGFRHPLLSYVRILNGLQKHKVPLVRVSSGMEWYFGKVRITALAPSVMLRNAYATYGVDINNASIVLRVEHHRADTVFNQSLRYQGKIDPEVEARAGQAVAILAGDAEFDSWARIAEEFPQRVTSSSHDPLVRKMLNLLKCSVIKVAHHGSMHSMPLDIFERMKPKLAVISTKQTTGTIHEGESTEVTRTQFPHPTTKASLQETCDSVLTTDGSFDWPRAAQAPASPPESDTQTHSGELGEQAKAGSVIIVIPPGGRPRWTKLEDTSSQVPPVISAI